MNRGVGSGGMFETYRSGIGKGPGLCRTLEGRGAMDRGGGSGACLRQHREGGRFPEEPARRLDIKF